MVSFSAFKEMIDDTRSQFDGKVSDLEIACYIFNLLHDDYNELHEEVNGPEGGETCHCGCDGVGCGCLHGRELEEATGQRSGGEKLPEGLLAALEKARRGIVSKPKSSLPDKAIIVTKFGEGNVEAFLVKDKINWTRDIELAYEFPIGEAIGIQETSNFPVRLAVKIKK